jgi:2-polyprenyl-6-methoxyphenol hydroxylase-like FAD-dependent oxidoreductase
VAIIGAGPVGLAIAIELARFELNVLVVDRRPAEDASVRPQLLVARGGDLANLEHLGIDIHDPWTVTMLRTRVERDLASGTMIRGEVSPPGAPAPAQDLWTLASQPPLALVPIGRLQDALLERAIRRVTTRFGCDVTRLRQHARHVSITCADGSSARATLAIVATGAARPLIGTARARRCQNAASTRMIAGLFAANSDRGRWVLRRATGSRLRAAVALHAAADDVCRNRALVDPQLAANATPEQMQQHYDAAARVHGLEGAPCLVKPRIFHDCALDDAHALSRARRTRADPRRR